MLSDFEREQCRNYKKVLDSEKTSIGRIALKLARQKSKEESREKILEQYTTGQQSIKLPKAEHKETDLEKILKFYR